MIRLPDLLRWVALLLVFLLCLGPACWNFIHIAVTAAHGYPLFPGAVALPYSSMQAGLIFGSATLIGPVGLAAALWTLSSRAHRLGTISMVVLWMLTALGILYTGVPALSAEWRNLATPPAYFDLLLNFVLLPAVGVALLQKLDARKRRSAD